MIFLRILIIGLLLLASGAQADDTIVGSWSGFVYEKKVGKYTVNVTIQSGARSGTVEFTRYPCGGSLSLISSGGGQYLYQESLNFGVKKCMKGLQVRLTIKDSNQVYFEERYQGTTNVWGNLYRVKQQKKPRRRVAPKSCKACFAEERRDNNGCAGTSTARIQCFNRNRRVREKCQETCQLP